MSSLSGSSEVKESTICSPSRTLSFFTMTFAMGVWFGRGDGAGVDMMGAGVAARESGVFAAIALDLVPCGVAASLGAAGVDSERPDTTRSPLPFLFLEFLLNIGA